LNSQIQFVKKIPDRLEKFVQPNRKEDELYGNDIPAGPEIERLTSSTQDHLISVTGGDGTAPLLT
jgi:hypothetical protein